jgi:hypothetical protein
LLVTIRYYQKKRVGYTIICTYFLELLNFHDKKALFSKKEKKALF